MTTLQVQIPETLLDRMRELAERENMSVGEFAASSLAEKVEALEKYDHFQQRAARGSREKFLRAMSKAPHVPPVSPDQPPPK